MSTYLELCNKLWLDLGLEGTGLTTAQGQTAMKGRVAAWIKRADLDVQNRWANWGFLYTTLYSATIVGSNLITAPSDMGVWDRRSIYVNDVLLAEMTFDEWRDGYRRQTDTGPPWGFCVTPDNNLRIIPIADQAYTIEADYFKRAQALSANTDNAHVPLQWERAILARATIYYAREEEIPLLLQEATIEFAEILAIMERVYLPGMQPDTTMDNRFVLEFE